MVDKLGRELVNFAISAVVKTRNNWLEASFSMADDLIMLVNFAAVNLVAFVLELFQLFLKVKRRICFSEFDLAFADRAKLVRNNMLFNTLSAKVASAMNVLERVKYNAFTKLTCEELNVGIRWLVDDHLSACECRDV